MNSITPELLLHAYRQGIFPMAEDMEDQDIFWVNPEMRGIIPLDTFHISSKLGRKIRQNQFRVTFNWAFPDVIRACAEPVDGRKTTWISHRIIELYEKLHETGYAHSIECWQDRDLAGGLYGISIGGTFCGESMFHRVTDASKVALTYLVARLRHGHFRLLDTQFVTPHLQQFGAIEIPRADYMAKLQDAIAIKGNIYSLDSDTPPERILQLATQTS